MNLQKVFKVGSKVRGPEYGVDPLPVEKGPLEPLYKAWSVLGAWPMAIGLMSSTFAVTAPLTVAMPLNKFQRLFPAQALGLVINATGSRVSVTYDPKYDRSRASVYCMNHTSVLDAHVALKVIPQVFCGMMHAHHFKLPIYGWFMHRANGIGVTKGEMGQFGSLRQQVMERAAKGISVLTFPEGRRTQNGRILPYRLGVFRMARDAGVPVVPLLVRGLWQILRKGEWVVRPDKLDIYVGPQIETEGLSDEQLEELARRMQRFTADYVERGIMGDPYVLDPRVAAG